MSVVARLMKRKFNEANPHEGAGRWHTQPKRHSQTRSAEMALGLNTMSNDDVEHSGLHPISRSAVEDSRFSNDVTHTAFETPLRTSRLFHTKASIVLIGIRGTGKSSLAVILSVASGRRLIDADQYFEKVTGMPRSALKKRYGVAEYRQQEARVMESMLVEHEEGCVIACGPGSMERSGQQLLRDHAKTHPVVHILRDPSSIQSYLKAWDTEKVRQLLTLSGPLYRACSNLEFFNVSETGSTPEESEAAQQDAQLELDLYGRSQTYITPFLTLKRVERDFVQFIAHALGDTADFSKPLNSFPLSQIPIESRKFTYAVSIPLSTILEKQVDIEEVESTADAFELQIDISDNGTEGSSVDPELAHRISQAVATIRRNVIVPLIFHVNAHPRSGSPEINGPQKRPDNVYLELVEHGLRFAPEFLTLDLSYSDAVLSQAIASKGQTRVIGHFSAPKPSSQGWDEPEYMALYERGMKLGCDFVRLSQPAATMDDNFAVQRFHHKIRSLPGPHPPLIAYNTGPLGRLSCCFNPILTPVTHPSLLAEVSMNNGPCITAPEAQQALFTSFALDPMRYYIFGANVTYSLSPAMHNSAFKVCGLPHRYIIHQAPSLKELSQLVEDPNFGGSSLALPYKTEVISLLDSMSPHARAIGAVNTIIPIRTLREDGTIPTESLSQEKSRAGPVRALYGDNTDWIGVYNCIRRGLSPANAVRPWSTALINGAGGMARAAIYALIRLGVQNIFVYNRTVANAEKLAHHYNRQNLKRNGGDAANTSATIRVIETLEGPWPLNFKQPTMVVSCIPQHDIGDQPAPNFQIPNQWLESPTGGVVVEMAYKPVDTPLVRQIRSLSHRGWVILDGLDFLPEQGFAQFELFTGRRSPRRLMKAVIRKEYKEEEQQRQTDGS